MKKRSTRFKIIYWTVVVVLVVLFFTAGTIAEALWPGSWLADVLAGSTLDITNMGNFFADNADAVVRALSTIFIVFLVVKGCLIIIRLISLRASNRRKTILALTYSFIKYAGIIIGFFALISIVMRDVGTMLAGAGIFVIVLGFGMQSILADIMAGLFIVFENTFEVGDIITVEPFRGEVIYIGIRTTKVRAVNGDVLVINNSELRRLINMTQEKSLAICDVTIEYSENLERVEGIINAHLATLPMKFDRIDGEARYLGTAEFNQSGIVLRIVADCAEENRMGLTREINRELKLLFDKNNIVFAVPHVRIVEQTKPVKKKA